MPQTRPPKPPRTIEDKRLMVKLIKATRLNKRNIGMAITTYISGICFIVHTCILSDLANWHVKPKGQITQGTDFYSQDSALLGYALHLGSQLENNFE